MGDTVSSPRMETPDCRQTGPRVQATRLPTEPALGTPAGPRSRENARPNLCSPGTAWAARAACPALPSRAPPRPAPGLPLAVAVASLLSAPPMAHLPPSVGCGFASSRDWRVSVSQEVETTARWTGSAANEHTQPP